MSMNQKAPLYNKLKNYSSLGVYPFHMPGHKCGRGGAFSEISHMDITEINGFDNLHQPEGVIAEAQKLCAKTFRAEESYFMVNGSTGGILAALLSVCGDGDEVLIARNCHRSVYSALTFTGATPRYFMPEYFSEYGFYGGVLPKTLEQSIQQFPHAKAVVLTSPTYEGFTSNIALIAELLHKHGMILIVDEAHGAHMGFHSYFPKTALEQGGDLVIQSLHKTLPSLTQTAVLHVQGNRVNRLQLRQALSMVQTSSPSYLFMGAMDACRSWLDQKGVVAFEEYVQKIMQLRTSLQSTKSITLLGSELCGKNGVFDVDFGKLVFILPNGTWSGSQLGQILLEKYHLQMEMCGPKHMIAMTSPVDEEEGFFRLQQAILELDEQLQQIDEKKDTDLQIQNCIPSMEMTPRQAYFAHKKEISLSESIGKVCGEFLIPYPPGAPLLVPGEVITVEMIKRLKYLLEKRIPIVGCEDTSLQKIRMIDRIEP